MVRRALVFISFVLVYVAAVPPSPPGRETVEQRDRVPASDRLGVHDLKFDASFARQAVDYLRSPNPRLADQMARSAAIAHLLSHARNFDYDVPRSPEGLVRALLGPRDTQAERSAICSQSIEYFDGAMLADPHWIDDVLRYLPDGFRFRGTLFLTFGYDIGVALGPAASLNCAHRHFQGHPRELLYYAIHELHHTGFMSYQTPPRLADVKSCADLLNLVEYSTQMEGMAVLAAYQRRQDDRALADDADYVALEDPKRMTSELAAYFKDYEYLKRRGVEPADADARAVLERMSSGERLWYRVGAYMARRIEESRGRRELTELVRSGPAQFVASYESFGLPGETPPQSQH